VKFSDFLIPMLASLVIHGVCFLSIPPGAVSAKGAPGDVQRVHVKLVPGGMGALTSPREKRGKRSPGSRRVDVRKKRNFPSSPFGLRRRGKGMEEAKGTVDLPQNEDMKGSQREGREYSRRRIKHSPSKNPSRRAGGEPGKELGRGQFVPPEIMGMAEPEYPSSSRRLGEEGVVVLSVVIDEEGRGRHVKVVKTSGHNRLDRSARKALVGATFSAATVAGIPVTSRKRVSVRFRLKARP